MKEGGPQHPPPPVIHVTEAIVKEDHKDPEYDVVVAGGTLGIFLALALQLRGHKVCVVERRRLQGRTQEWNISRKELETLVEEGLLSQEELESTVATEWDFCRIGFKGGGGELLVSEVLNVGVKPDRLIEVLKNRFLGKGGVVMEHTAFKAATVSSMGVEIRVGPGAPAPKTSRDSDNTRCITSRMLIDCMGHFSPIVRQIRSEAGQRPDGMVVVVGACFVPSSSTPCNNNNDVAPADLLYSFTDSFDNTQLFWEAFPAEGGTARTVYAFQYIDTHPSRPTFTHMLTTFLTLLPQYQGIQDVHTDVQFKRILLGGFPCYTRSSPLPPAFDRVLQVGDAAAQQSPLSFGGFGAMVRHLPRLSRGVDDALRHRKLSKRDLGWLQPYQPSLAVAWLFQRAMSVKPGKERGRSKTWVWPSGHINRLLRCNFEVMRRLGDRVLRPFVLDRVQAVPLGLTMVGMMLKDPLVVMTVVLQRPLMVLDWCRHFLMLSLGSVLWWGLGRWRGVTRGWYWFQRVLDALEYGCAGDYAYRPGRVVHRPADGVVVGGGGMEAGVGVVAPAPVAEDIQKKKNDDMMMMQSPVSISSSAS